MLSVFTSEKVKDGVVIYQGATWHIGEKKPLIAHPVYSIQADGHELSYIYKHFNNIPWVDNKDVVLYHNPFAQFIWNNLDGS